MKKIKSVKIIISGRVQNVWYRGWTVKQALSMGLDGWVRNMRDGSVEALFSGPEDKVDKIIKSCWKGPNNAYVTNIDQKSEKILDKKGFYQVQSEKSH